MSWIDSQLVQRGIGDPRVLAAMRRVPRECFVPDAALAHADEALRIGHGQTISQPYVVALICSALDVPARASVLDVGTGSGYQAAVLAELAGRVVTIERVPELVELARRNLAAAGYLDRVELHTGNGWDGLPERAPFDAIAVAAAASKPPAELIAQLAPGGRLVVPVGENEEQYLELFTRTRLAPVRFVPLIH